MSDQVGPLSSSAIETESVLPESASASVDSEEEECIRIGPQYQADVPDLVSPYDVVDEHRALDMLQWIPCEDLSDVSLEVYVQRSKKLYGYEEEQALGMLLFHDYNFEKAFADQINYVPDLEEWTTEEKVLFKEAFNFHGKDFDKFVYNLPSKPKGAIISYYYLNKKHKRRRGSSSRKLRATETEPDPQETNIDDASPDEAPSEGSLASEASLASTLEATHDEDIIAPPSDVECHSEDIISPPSDVECHSEDVIAPTSDMEYQSEDNIAPPSDMQSEDPIVPQNGMECQAEGIIDPLNDVECQSEHVIVSPIESLSQDNIAPPNERLSQDVDPSNDAESRSQDSIRSTLSQKSVSSISPDRAFFNPDDPSNQSWTEEERKRVSVLPPLTFLQLLGCSQCSLYFPKATSQKIHMERVHGNRVFTAREAAFDFNRLKASQGADHLLSECACIACGLFFLDPSLKKRHLAKIHPEVKHEAVRTRLPFDLSPAHTSHNHLKCNECALSFSSSRVKYDHNRKVHSMKFDFPDINVILAEESRQKQQQQKQQQQPMELPFYSNDTSSSSSKFSVTPSPTWSNLEVVNVLEAIRLHGPNFFLIAAKVPSKNVNQIRKFYFLNKRRYNLDRMDRDSSSMDEGVGPGEYISKKQIETSRKPEGEAAAAARNASPLGPAECRPVAPTPSSIGADCEESRPAEEDDTPIIPPEPRPFRQARTKRAGRYVEQATISSSEEEDLVETEEEKKSVSDDESSDPNFEGEEEEEEGEVSDESDTGRYGRGRRRKRNNYGKMSNSSSGIAYNLEAMKGVLDINPVRMPTTPFETASTTSPAVATSLASTSAPGATTPLRTTASSMPVTTMSTSHLLQPRSSFVPGHRYRFPSFVSASASSPSFVQDRRLSIKQFPNGVPSGSSQSSTPANNRSVSSTGLLRKEGVSIPSSADLGLNIVPSMQPLYKRTTMYQNLVQFFPPTRPIASEMPKYASPSRVNLAGVRGTCFYASSSISLESNGPARAVTVHAGDCWKSGSDVLPQTFEFELYAAIPADRLLYTVIEGVNSKSEFADPASFRFEGKGAQSRDWVSLFMVNNAAQHKGRDLVFTYDNRFPFKFYRMVIFKTMSDHPKAKPMIGGLRLMERPLPG